MIIKSFEINKINAEVNNIFLFYGPNDELKKEKINQIFLKKKQSKILNYFEKEILDNKEILEDEILNKSLFEKHKTIIINNVTDKFHKLAEELIPYLSKDIIFVLNSTNLEKRSKLRLLFEKEKNLVCIPFYLDNFETLLRLVNEFIKDNDISISKANINLLIYRAQLDRKILKNELEKIKLYPSGKTIDEEILLKLTNFSENYNISSLIDFCISKNDNKTIKLLNDCNFTSEESITIIRIFLNKAKKLLVLRSQFEKNKNLEQTITNAKPPIFWKDKDIIKKQIMEWSQKNIKELIFTLNDIELQTKKNLISSTNILSNFLIQQSRSISNN